MHTHMFYCQFAYHFLYPNYWNSESKRNQYRHVHHVNITLCCGNQRRLLKFQQHFWWNKPLKKSSFDVMALWIHIINTQKTVSVLINGHFMSFIACLQIVFILLFLFGFLKKKILFFVFQVGKFCLIFFIFPFFLNWRVPKKKKSKVKKKDRHKRGKRYKWGANDIFV